MSSQSSLVPHLHAPMLMLVTACDKSSDCCVRTDLTPQSELHTVESWMHFVLSSSVHNEGCQLSIKLLDSVIQHKTKLAKTYESVTH